MNFKSSFCIHFKVLVYWIHVVGHGAASKICSKLCEHKLMDSIILSLRFSFLLYLAYHSLVIC